MATTTCGDKERDYNIICPICQDEFKDPVIIDCHHSFCRTCIETWINQSGPRLQMYGQFKCPSCKSTNKLPYNGAAGFIKSFYIEQMKDAKAKLQSSYPMCPKHNIEDLRFYCTECETTMCRDCKVLNHEGHSAECVADVANDMRARLRENINKTEADLEKLCHTKEACKVDKTKVNKLKQSARNKVKNQVQEVKKTLDNIAGVLDQNICSYFQTYEDELDKETSEADSKTDSLQRFKTTVVQEIKGGSDHNVIGKYKRFLKIRGQIVVQDRKLPNPDYNTKLAHIYRKGSINVSDLQSMIGKIAEENMAILQGQSELEPTAKETVVLPAARKKPIKEMKIEKEEIELSTDTGAVFTKTDKC